MSDLPALPDPRAATIADVTAACDRIAEYRESTDDLEVITNIRRLLSAAYELYDQFHEAQARIEYELRLTEARIGKLLPRESGGRGKLSSAHDGFSRNEAYELRMMAENEDAWRDKHRFNDWHYSLPDDWTFIDIDGVEVCHQCGDPLLLYETSRDPKKATTYIRRLAEMADIPAVLIVVPDDDAPLADSSEVRWRFVNKQHGADWGPLSEWRAVVATIRAWHDSMKHWEAAA